MPRTETLCFEYPKFINREGVVGTAPDGRLKVEGSSNFVSVKRQKAALGIQLLGANRFLLEPSENSIGVSIPSTNRRSHERALREGEVSAELAKAATSVVVDVLGEEAWWTADYMKPYLPNMQRAKPVEQYIFGNNEGQIRLFNFTKKALLPWQRETMMRCISRVYAYLGTNIFNELKDFVISRPTGGLADSEAMFFTDEHTIWLNPDLFIEKPTIHAENALEVTLLEGALSHELGHSATPELVMRDFAEYSGLRGKYASEFKKTELHCFRGLDTVNIFGNTTSVDEEVADVFTLMTVRPELSREYIDLDTGYLVDSLLNAFDDAGYPCYSDLSRTPLYWQRRTGDNIRYPVLSVPRDQDFHIVLQYQDRFIRGIDYDKDDN